MSSRVNWETPKFSRKEIENASKVIINPFSAPKEKEWALDVLNNWRSSHAYPLHVITSNLRRNNKNAIVVQRLKRLNSIVGKLTRYPTMNLYRMQDLGGCRVIVDSIDKVYETLNNYKSSSIRHILKKEYDYIQNPKSSGYRSYHMVYQFQSDKKDIYNKNILIEVQFRTQLQHIWATTVEMTGLYTKESLKSSNGNPLILRFFVLVSAIFSIMENTPLSPEVPQDYNEIIKELKNINNRLNLLEEIDSLKLATEHLHNNYTSKGGNKNKYYILTLSNRYGNFQLSQIPFNIYDYDKAIKTYEELEIPIQQTYNILDDPTMLDSVLVSANSIESLKAAYPNYFIDTSKFVSILKKILY